MQSHSPSRRTLSQGARSFSVGEDNSFEEEIKPMVKEIDTNLADEVQRYR